MMPPEVLPGQIAAPQILTLLTLLFQQYEDVGSTPGEIRSLERDGLVRALALVWQRKRPLNPPAGFLPRVHAANWLHLFYTFHAVKCPAVAAVNQRSFAAFRQQIEEDCIFWIFRYAPKRWFRSSTIPLVREIRGRPSPCLNSGPACLVATT